MIRRNAFEIKLFMAFLMVLDHLHYIPGLIPENLNLIFHVITRCVGVWFAYAAVEGFCYTRNKITYNARLFLWAGIMAAGNLFFHVSNNIFLTLALGILALNVMFYESDKITNVDKTIKIIRKILGFIMVIVSFPFAEGAMVVIPFMIITYFLREKPKSRNITYVIFAILLGITSYVPYDTLEMTLKMLAYNCDFMFITVIPFIYLYNGKRGPKTKFSKYFFYVFYPAHLWIIATIGYFIAK